MQIINSPNPFNPTTRIDYTLKNTGFVELSIFNSKGQLIKNLINENQEKGNYSVIWNGKNNEGISVASGVYFYKLQTEFAQLTKKMLLMK